MRKKLPLSLAVIILGRSDDMLIIRGVNVFRLSVSLCASFLLMHTTVLFVIRRFIPHIAPTLSGILLRGGKYLPDGQPVASVGAEYAHCDIAAAVSRRQVFFADSL